MTTISTLSLTSPLRFSVGQAQAALTQDQMEVSSGTYSDLGLHLGAGTGNALSLESNIDSLNSFTTSNNVASARLSSTATVLTSVLSSAQTIQSDLISAASAGGATSALATTSLGAAQDLVSDLNTTVGGEAIFGGINAGTQPITAYTTTQASVQSAFQSYLTTNGYSASTLTGTQMTTFLQSSAFTDAFSGTSWSSASSQTISSTVSPGQTLTTSVSANASGFQQIAQAYTMLSEFTGSTISSEAQAAVVSTASTLVSTGIDALNNVQTGVGVAQAAVTSANAQITSQVNVLQTSVGDLTNVDTYALSSQVTTLQTQLEASYQLTSRLQSLSLVNYLANA